MPTFAIRVAIDYSMSDDIHRLQKKESPKAPKGSCLPAATVAPTSAISTTVTVTAVVPRPTIAIPIATGTEATTVSIADQPDLLDVCCDVGIGC